MTNLEKTPLKTQSLSQFSEKEKKHMTNGTNANLLLLFPPAMFSSVHAQGGPDVCHSLLLLAKVDTFRVRTSGFRISRCDSMRNFGGAKNLENMGENEDGILT